MRPTGKMHSAHLATSPRLQKLLAFLRKVGERGATARDIREGCAVEAVSAAVDELRDSGIIVACKPEPRGADRKKQYVYRLGVKDPAPVQGDLFGEGR